MGRMLKQDNVVTVVTTPAQLLNAIEAGDPHIEIQAHLNLSLLKPPSVCCSLRSTVQSITVRFRLQAFVTQDVESSEVRGKP